ncbi:MAG: 3-oxoacyl-[acyl-carrier-protein] reductase [candidate division WOR-3 bacterium]|uniref:3-oxoacyl-[acyl-carrier-protein] reductase n=1 Tax=candidate division WOR-3 bacterium TaxID=2052148 RepID=A0A7C1NAT0_UNCW3|nr:3-oxoacyl-[acyl-carrier-protein] reductase [candidate division WOR-3 bacterium]
MVCNLNSKIALVTGGGAGIGRAIAKRLAESGAIVAVCDLIGESAGQVVQEIEQAGGRAYGYALDVADNGQVEQVVKQIESELGGVQILVNNAGITRDSLLIRMSEDDFDRVLAVNLKGAFNLTKACCRSMMRLHWGRIINISSVIGQMGNAGQSNYAAAKAGLIGFTKSVAKELAARNITVNAIAPGFIATAMTEKLDPAVRQSYIAAIPLKRAGTPEDVASLCLFLASDEAGYITGQVIRVDGGMLM